MMERDYTQPMVHCPYFIVEVLSDGTENPRYDLGYFSGQDAAMDAAYWAVPETFDWYVADGLEWTPINGTCTYVLTCSLVADHQNACVVSAGPLEALRTMLPVQADSGNCLFTITRHVIAGELVAAFIVETVRA